MFKIYPRNPNRKGISAIRYPDSNLVDCTLDFASQYQLIQEKYQLWKRRRTSLL
ncbi:MAG UNVERIFIED_CONTAM: hypothetical protein LVR29_21705 [Microcystis novacekii LVE1205-3]|jgi:hypothetical protein